MTKHFFLYSAIVASAFNNKNYGILNDKLITRVDQNISFQISRKMSYGLEKTLLSILSLYF